MPRATSSPRRALWSAASLLPLSVARHAAAPLRVTRTPSETTHADCKPAALEVKHGNEICKESRRKVEENLHELKRGTLKSGSGQRVKTRKQAIAIGLAEARRVGGKVPAKKSSKKSSKKK